MTQLSLLYRRLLHRHDNLGWRGLIGLRHMPAPALTVCPPHPFDLAHGTDTGGFFPGELLTTGSSGDLYNTAYYGISPSSLIQALARIPGSLEQFTFVDLGCGKGRALLVASEVQPFVQICGVELSPELCRVARSNTKSRERIQVLNQDATTVRYPEGPLVVFLYHPFLKPVLRRALANLKSQLRTNPRPVWLLFANPSYQRLVESTGMVEEVWTLDFPLSAEDTAADRMLITHERYTLYRAVVSPPA